MLPHSWQVPQLFSVDASTAKLSPFLSCSCFAAWAEAEPRAIAPAINVP